MKTSTISTIAAIALSASAAPLQINSGTITLELNIVDQGGDIGANALGGGDLFTFSSTHAVIAEPGQVVNETTPTGGLAGASGTFNFGINAAANMICYNITINNFQGEFESPANTATHIHEAARGASGPPRIAFPNPTPLNGDPAIINTAGCLAGPFVTGVMVEGVDSGEGFHISQIEANPAGFMADIHSSLALPGAVRGQLA